MSRASRLVSDDQLQFKVAHIYNQLLILCVDNQHQDNHGLDEISVKITAAQTCADMNFHKNQHQNQSNPTFQ